MTGPCCFPLAATISFWSPCASGALRTPSGSGTATRLLPGRSPSDPWRSSAWPSCPAASAASPA
eukprot:15124015-Heterocapsa_arctica.AAC.1